MKTNIGHLDTAAGVVGVIKTVLALKARELPPSLHFTAPNPELGLAESPFYVNATLAPWQGDVLRAGVSSFGIGGTNAHVVLEEAPARTATTARSRPHVLPISAATPTAAATAAADLAAHLRANPDERLDDVAYTLQHGRWTLPHRRFVVGRGIEDAIEALERPVPARHTAHESAKDREVVFTFSGQGAQRVGMGHALYAHEPVFRAEVDRAAEILLPYLGIDVRELLYPADGERAETINRTEYAQPALFVVEYALATLWTSWGVRPAAMLGHSVGELVAACLAGVLSLTDALQLVVARGRLMQGAPAGTMVAVPLAEADVTPLLADGLAIAAVNGPRECVVSGPADDVTAFEARLAERGVTSKRLVTSHAFHSSMMDAAAAAFELDVARVPLAPPRIPFVSTVTGTWITDAEATSPAYWASQLRSTVRFADGLRTVRGLGALVLEVGPGQVLTRLARTGDDGPTAIASLPSVAEHGDAVTDVLTALGELWCHGASVEWAALHGESRRTVLPTYPFERERYWVDPPRDRATHAGSSGLAVRGFRRIGPATPSPAEGTWLVLTDDGVLDGLVERLRGADRAVVTAPAVDYRQLLASLADDERVAGVVHGGALDDAHWLALGDALTGRGDDAARLVTVASGVFDVTGDEALVPGALSTWAGGRRRLLDVVVPTTPVAARRLAAALAAELDGAAEPVVALRGGHRFVPSLEPVVANGGDHSGAHYALAGGEVFRRALARAGATVSDLSATSSGTAVVVLDATSAEAELARAASTVAESGVHACEVHVVGDAALVEARVALIGRASDIPWTSVSWPALDDTTLDRLVATVVGAAPGGCLVVAAPEVLDETAALPADAVDDADPGHQDEIEHDVAAIFSDLLGVARIAPTTNFFELGGHSLLAAQCVAQLRTTCGVELALRTFVGEPTIRGVAAAVRGLRAEAGHVPLAELPTIVPDPASASVPFPLTDVQQAYWVGRTGVFELGNVGMHGYEEFDIPDLDLPRMQEAFRTLIGRHGMLRAIVLPHGEQQILTDVPAYVIETEDVRGLPGPEADAALERTRAAMSHQVFVPEHWPLFELRATVMDGNRTRLHYSMDGLITDAWASNIVTRELVQLYLHPDVALPELELSFRDYVLAERGLASTEPYQRAETYWLDRIPDLALAPDLPLARDPRTIDSPRFERVAGILPTEPWGRVKTWAARRGITPTALLLTVWSEVLATWSKNRRFTLNLPMANRLPLHPEVDAIIGDFTSVTLLEVDAASEVPFGERACAVRDRLLTDLDHKYFSGVRVVREMKRLRGDAAAAMPVIFTSLFLDHGEDVQLGEIAYSISQTPQIWIDAQVYETDDAALTVDIDAVDELFPDGMVAAMNAACIELLHWLAADEEHWNHRVPSLVPGSDLSALTEYNRTDGPVPAGLLHEPFFATAARTPERPAVITPDRTLTYGELATRANGIAARLDVHPNELVAVVMAKGWEQCAAVLGILAAGGAYLPIDPELPDERIRLLLDHGKVRTVLTQSHLASRFADVPTVVGVDALPLEPDAVVPASPAAPDDLAYVIFTSGSTGLPKGVMIDHRGALNTVVDVNERFGVGPDDRVLALSSLSFDLSVYDVFGPLAVGGAVVVPAAGTHHDPAAWLDLLTTCGVTIWNSVPALMELLVEHMNVNEATSTLRLVMLSGDWLPVTLPDRIRRMLGAPEVVSLGGATEASIWSILYPIDEVRPEWTSIPYGRPMKNQTFHVLDEALRPRPTGVPGQLYIGGIGLAQGYLHDKAKTDASFIVHPVTGDRLYRTGDLGRFLPSGDIEFLGREDFQVKVQGYRIELGEIEVTLMQHPPVRAAVVVIQGEPRGAKRLVAFVVPHVPGELPEDLREFLLTKLPAYMVPDVYLEIDTLPLTANGKVDRRALVVPDDVADASAPPYQEPRTPIEEAVAEVWSTMLGVDRVGIHDNFFLLGGDSLMAMRAVVHLRKALDLEIPVRVLFDSETLEDTALVIEEQLIAEIDGMSDDEATTLLST